MNRRKTALLSAVVLGAATFSGISFVPVLAASTLTVASPSRPCPGGTYPTITLAVTAASAGDTIKVCAGTYPEKVVVTKQLTFLGAQAGKDGRFRNNPSKESVVDNVTGDFALSGGGNNVKIDGFTITGAGASPAPLGPNDYGIEAFSGTSGLVVTNNIIKGNRWGINMQNPNGTMPSVIQKNAFDKNSTGQDPTCSPNCGGSGTGVFICCGPANNTSIVDNFFTGHTQTAINFAGNPASHSTGLSVKRNISVDDATFVVATNSDGAVISQNAIAVRPSTTPQGSGMLDFGSNVDLLIDSNLVYGGANSGTSGIRVAAFSGTPSTNTRVTNNRVYNRYNGVRLTDTVGATVSANGVSGSSNVGILMESGANNSFLHNSVSSSAIHDCQDMTTGTGTAGTANHWVGNTGDSNNSLPAAICVPEKSREEGR
jgi:parallel beta-helix repeat protein